MSKNRKVLFLRVTPEAKEWAVKKAEGKPGLSANIVVERLILNDKRKQLARQAS